MALRYASTQQAELIQLKRQAAERARLAEPFPATVTLADYVKRDLNRSVAAGDCSIYRKHAFKKDTWLPIVCIERPNPLQDHYAITLWDAPAQHEWGGFGELKVEWHVQAWKSLSTAMRNALCYLAGDGGKKPRANTLKALVKRGLVADGKATSAALNLYRLHKADFK